MIGPFCNATLTKCMNMDIWVVGTLKHIFITGCYTETKYSKHKALTSKASFFVIGPFCAPDFIVVTLFAPHHDIITQPHLLSCYFINFNDHISSYFLQTIVQLIHFLCHSPSHLFPLP